MKHWGKTVFLVLVVLLVCACAAIAFAPVWLLEQTTRVYLKKNGVESRWVQVDGYRLHYLESPSKIAGPERPVFLIHGLGARASDWSRMIPEFSAAGYHVYAVDLLGYGDSPKPDDGDYSLDGEERIALGFLRALHIERADVGGWSMGGWVAMKIALNHPEMVRRLMVYDTAGLYYEIGFDQSLFSPADRAGFERLMDHLEPGKRRVSVPAFAIPAMLRRIQENRFIVEQSFQSMLHGRELLDFRLRTLQMPMLILWGTEDRLIPVSVGLRLHALVPQSVFVGIKECGHLMPSECAKPAVDATLQFLRATPPLPPSTTYVDGPSGI